MSKVEEQKFHTNDQVYVVNQFQGVRSITPPSLLFGAISQVRDGGARVVVNKRGISNCVDDVAVSAKDAKNLLVAKIDDEIDEAKKYIAALEKQRVLVKTGLAHIGVGGYVHFRLP